MKNTNPVYDECYVPAGEMEKVYAKERERIVKRRDAVNEKRVKKIRFPKGKDGGQMAVGLALSGGGIRSATFNLGILQALKRWDVFPFVDYLSSVSGGGYIASCLTWLMSTIRAFPFGVKREDHDQLGGSVLHWLRSHGKYLIPGKGLTVWPLLAAVIKGTFVNLLILVPLLLLLVMALGVKLGCAPPLLPFVPLEFAFRPVMFSWAIFLGIVLFIMFLALTVFSAVTSRLNICRSYRYQVKWSVFMGYLLLLSFVFSAIGSVQIVDSILPWDYLYHSISAVSLSGVVMFLGALKNITKENETKRIRSLLLSVGLILMIYGLFLWFFEITKEYDDQTWFVAAAACSVVLSLLADVNHICMHRYYRDRLMKAYMPPVLSKKDWEENNGRGIFDPETPSGTDWNPDNFRLCDIPDDGENPYHIINTNMLAISSDNSKLAARGGDSFILSPEYCGSASTGYRETKDYINGGMNLATAFSISGAAVDPNTYVTRSRPVAFVMSLLNARLGYWIRNPKRKGRRLELRPQYLLYMVLEMLGLGISEKSWSVHLADGGHLENLGLYELIRRRCKYIIASDAGADASWTFSDLGKIIEMVRVDFGASVDIRVDDMKPDGKTGLSALPFTVATIRYADSPKEVSYLIYFKAVMIDAMGADVASYNKQNDPFPNQSTADQFFNEEQFEAYRELGYTIGTAAFENRTARGVDIPYGSMDEVMKKLFKNADAMLKKKRNPKTVPLR